MRRPLTLEHLVRINDSDDPRVVPISRAQLWRGLQIRAEYPRTFLPWMDACQIDRQADGSLRRELRFGSQIIRDRVLFEIGHAVHIEVIDPDSEGRFLHSMRIEEPAPGELFLRFTYEALSGQHHADCDEAGTVREAYRQTDIDTVFRLRQLAATGVLDSEEAAS
ncbi:MAG TPA: DUF1857 family protein [Xanthomonadaceae bacterium]|nr:DUF1857 family protein [Xanthomonadaceae bacterium]